ncbi:glycine oxidase [Paracoccus halophilus]|uniref:Glycine oxidase n=1 Tax=Paracoccus halophilus TaxID=376733 RepID=A0A099F297_9RHOB|nr:FAD-dependent oxidoreductase [Paracoccus halophilus]KGJ04388.1 thiamine biosynthesis protein thio [Paracoccus halophilus]SFA54928.1 glycine oxidase [Paracoccus halophilus]
MTAATILGAGVMGLAIASELASRGIMPRIIDPAGGPGPHGCSWYAGGMLAPHCEAESAEPAVLHHGLKAAEWWQANGADITYEGTLVLAPSRDRAELDRFARLTRSHDTVSAQEIAALEPDLEDRFQRGLLYRTEAHLNPREALRTLRDRLAAQGIEIEPDGKPSGLIVDARGLAARDALPDLRGVRGEMLVLRCPEVTLTRTIRMLHPRIPLYIVPRGDGLYMIGATMLETGGKHRVTARSAVELLNAAYALHPGFAEAEIVELGSDARPAFPDNLPRLRRRGNTLYANGLYRHGYLLAPAVARMAADHIQTGQKPEFMDENHP